MCILHSQKKSTPEQEFLIVTVVSNVFVQQAEENHRMAAKDTVLLKRVYMPRLVGKVYKVKID